jgi:chromate reductase
MESKKIAILVGSLRKESFSRKTAKALVTLAPESLSLEILEIGELQMYNQDLEEVPPAAWTEFRSRLKGFDGVLFVTPEYNRSVPAVMKNAIDIGSRPEKFLGWKTRRYCECFTRSAERIRCKSSPAAIVGICKRSGYAAARSLYR